LVCIFISKHSKRIDFLAKQTIALLMLTLGSLMESTNLFPKLVCIFDSSHAVENIFSQATKKDVTSLGILPLVTKLR